MLAFMIVKRRDKERRQIGLSWGQDRDEATVKWSKKFTAWHQFDNPRATRPRA